MAVAVGVFRQAFAAVVLAAVAGEPVASIAQTSPTPVASAAPASPVPAASGDAGTVDPAISARAKDWLHRAQTGKIDRAQLNDQMNALLTDSLVAQVASQLGPLGDVSTLTFIEKRRIGSQTAYRFLATFKAAKFYELLVIDDAGKISGLRFLPASE